jgi:uncharacterized protein YeaO (DUF488 family)
LMNVKIKCIYDKPEPDDGYRLLVMRKWPRGVRKDSVDAWEKELGTPPELIQKWKEGSVTWSEFSRKYLLAMKAQSDKIGDLAARAKTQTVTLLCGCRDEKHCHRSLLKQLILKAG